jgi:hypothetical protein
VAKLFVAFFDTQFLETFGETMKPLLALSKPLMLLAAQPLNLANAGQPLPQIMASDMNQRETIRHILLGSPGAVRQTIHLLHTLRYAETVLWSPILTVEEPLTITTTRGEAMSLLRT